MWDRLRSRPDLQSLAITLVCLVIATVLRVADAAPLVRLVLSVAAIAFAIRGMRIWKRSQRR